MILQFNRLYLSYDNYTAAAFSSGQCCARRPTVTVTVTTHRILHDCFTVRLCTMYQLTIVDT